MDASLLVVKSNSIIMSKFYKIYNVLILLLLALLMLMIRKISVCTLPNQPGNNLFVFFFGY